MTNKRSHQEYTHRRELEAAGWQLRKRDSIAFNGGSETPHHFACKALVGYQLRERGYRIGSEVAKDGIGEIDVISYGRDEPAFAVECERNPQEDIIQDKVERYCHNEPYRDVFVLNVSNMPDNIMDALKWVDEQL